MNKDIEVGSIISTQSGLRVVTRIENGAVTHHQDLEKYIAKNFIIDYNGEPITIQEIIDLKCDELISKRGVIEF